jgi:hypothetical protein
MTVWDANLENLFIHSSPELGSDGGGEKAQITTQRVR